MEIGREHLLTIPHYWITSLYSDERGPQAVERVSQYLKIIKDFSQQSLKNVDWEEFIYETKLSHDVQSGGSWVDLNSSKSLVADSYLLHALAHRKILPYSQQKLKTLEEISIRHLYLPLSPNHGAVIYN